MVRESNAFCFRLRELRRAKGWSQEKLAAAADMHRTHLADIESSLRNSALENLEDLVKRANARFAIANLLPDRLIRIEAILHLLAERSQRFFKYGVGFH